MTESNDDIFNHIKSVMRHHEEPYDEGAWERFNATQAPVPVKKGAIRMWKWAMAAAAALAAVVVLSRIWNVSTPAHDSAPEVATVTPAPIDSSPAIARNSSISLPPAPDAANGGTGSANDYYISQTVPENHAAARPPTKLSLVGLTQRSIGSANTNTLIVAPEPIRQSPGQVAVNEPVKKAEIDFWKNKVERDAPATTPENRPSYQTPPVQVAITRPERTAQPRKEKNNKWQPSLYVSPLFGDQGIDMGYGVAVGYAINDKIKISSGIAYNKLSASRNYGAGPSGALMADAPSRGPVGATGAAGAAGATGSSAAPSLDSKAALTSAYNFVAGPQTNSLQQVDASLSGFDIPVEINYNISKKLYASAGVSGLVVINDSKKYTYVDNRNVKVSVETNGGALKEDRSVTFSEQNTTTEPIQAPSENIPFLGFYNISFGYRQKISRRTGVALEPFLKVPMKNVTQENLKYMGTGIRLKFDL